MSINKNVLSFVATIFLLIIVVFWIDKSNLYLLLRVDVFNIIVSLLIAFFIFVSSGIKYYFIRKQFGVSLQIKDIILFPFVMNLWGIAIPFQGSMIFRTVFFMKRYNMTISKSLSISLYLLMITFCLTGAFSLLFAFYNNLYYSWLSLVSIVFITNPFFIFLASNVLKKIANPRRAILFKIHLFLQSTTEGMIFLLKNLKFTMGIFLLSLLHFSLNILWLYWISISLDFDLSLISAGLIGAIMSISLILKITPGNLGVVQLVSGGIMSMAGYSPDEAVLITLFATAISLALALTVGVFGNFYYFKTLRIFRLSDSAN